MLNTSFTLLRCISYESAVERDKNVTRDLHSPLFLWKISTFRKFSFFLSKPHEETFSRMRNDRISRNIETLA